MPVYQLNPFVLAAGWIMESEYRENELEFEEKAILFSSRILPHVLRS